jgi:arginine decarboxylase
VSPHDDAPTTTSGEGAPLVISVRSATGTGQTPLSAFDDALHGAGVGDLNLIPLSSVVPPSAEIRRGDHSPFPATHGDRLYCVLSVAHAELRGRPRGPASGGPTRARRAATSSSTTAAAASPWRS